MWNQLDDNFVVRLVRLDFGPVALGGLAAGEWRLLTPVEVGAFRQQAVVVGASM